MKELYKAELLRFRSWGVACALLHLGVLAFLTRVLDLAQQPVLIHQLFAVVYGLLGLLLGLYQMAGYRRPNVWLQLLHRPLPSSRIALPLLGAGATWLLAAIMLPLLLVSGWQELMTARVVDLRHLLLPVAATLIACAAYATGCYLMLRPARYAVFALVLLALPATAEASGPAVLLLHALLLGWLVVLLAASFRPDLSAPPRGIVATLLVAGTLQAGLYVSLLVALDGAFQIGWIAYGTHPLNTAEPLPGGAVEASNADGDALLLAALRHTDHPQAALWREQVAISEIHGIGPDIRRLPRRHQLGNVASLTFDDTEAGVRWAFSHDDMRFHGARIVDGRPVGALGIDGDNPFPTPPLPSANGLLLAGATIYRFDEDRGRIVERARIADGEVMAGTPRAFDDRLAVLSDRALYLFDLRGDRGDGALPLQYRVPLLQPIGTLLAIDGLQLLDGWLLSVGHLRGAHDDRVAPNQQLLHVTADGSVTLLARRELIPDFPPLYRWFDWWLSPAWHALRDAATTMFASADPLQAGNPPARPASVITAALALLLLSLIGAAWLTARLRLAPSSRLGWMAACAVLGVPALLSLWLIRPAGHAAQPQSRHDAAVVAATAPAASDRASD